MADTAMPLDDQPRAQDLLRAGGIGAACGRSSSTACAQVALKPATLTAASENYR
jgi:hypothetical protein